MADFTFTEPTKRKRIFQSKDAPFPVPIATITGEAAGLDQWCYYTGHLVDNHVIVSHTGDMDFLYKMVSFTTLPYVYCIMHQPRTLPFLRDK